MILFMFMVVRETVVMEIVVMVVTVVMEIAVWYGEDSLFKAPVTPVLDKSAYSSRSWKYIY